MLKEVRSEPLPANPHQQNYLAGLPLLNFNFTNRSSSFNPSCSPHPRLSLSPSRIDSQWAGSPPHLPPLLPPQVCTFTPFPATSPSSLHPLTPHSQPTTPTRQPKLLRQAHRKGRRESKAMLCMQRREKLARRVHAVLAQR